VSKWSRRIVTRKASSGRGFDTDPSNDPGPTYMARFSLPIEPAPYGGDADPDSGSDPYARSASSADSFSCAPRSRRSWPVGFDSSPRRVFSVSSSRMLLVPTHRGTIGGLIESG